MSTPASRHYLTHGGHNPTVSLTGNAALGRPFLYGVLIKTFFYSK